MLCSEPTKQEMPLLKMGGGIPIIELAYLQYPIEIVGEILILRYVPGGAKFIPVYQICTPPGWNMKSIGMNTSPG